MAIAYLNGEWQAPEDARISVFDRGFMFGDGVYEVMPVYWSRVFTLNEHLARLSRSLGEIRLESPCTDEQWCALFDEAIQRSGEHTALLYLQVTRGVAPERSHEYPENAEPTVLITVTPAPALERREVTPYRMITREDYRWGRGDIKVVSLVAAGLLKNEALDAGYDDAILVRDGLVTESTASNVFIVQDGTIITPPRSRFLLHGITRDHVLELARTNRLPVEERDIPVSELQTADEVWITSTGHEIWPVGEVDDKVIGNGEAGVVWQTMDALFQASKRYQLLEGND